MQMLHSKKWLLLSLIGALLVLLVALALFYRLTFLREPDQSLLTLLPDEPICYLSIKDLGGFVETFARSEFGRQARKMPVLAEIQRGMWWRQIVYQKQHWEYEMGGKLNLKAFKGYFGEEAILSLYHRGDEISFLLISLVGAKEKLEIAALTAADFVNPKYKRIKKNYRGIDINTITGYPRDFSYAFIGKIGLLGLDISLIKETIDIHAGGKKNFISRNRTGDYIRQQYDSDSSTIYADFSRFTQTYAFDDELKSILAPVHMWSVGNRYENGVIHSRHRFFGKASRKPAGQEAPKKLPPIDRSLLSILPATTTLLVASHDEDLKALWMPSDTTQFIKYRGNPIVKPSRYLESEFAFALLGAKRDKTAPIPAALLILTISDRPKFNADFTALRNGNTTIYGKPLKFLKPQDYRGTEIYPVQLRIGFLFAVTGGCAIVENYWIISSTLDALKTAIDTFSGNETALSETGIPAFTNRPGDSQIFVQPNRFIPQFNRLAPILGLIASTSGQDVDSMAITRIANNLFPLEALGAITAEIDSEDSIVDAQIRIVLEPNAD